MQSHLLYPPSYRVQLPTELFLVCGRFVRLPVTNFQSILLTCTWTRQKSLFVIQTQPYLLPLPQFFQQTHVVQKSLHRARESHCWFEERTYCWHTSHPLSRAWPFCSLTHSNQHSALPTHHNSTSNHPKTHPQTAKHWLFHAFSPVFFAHFHFSLLPQIAWRREIPNRCTHKIICPTCNRGFCTKYSC